MLTAVKVPRKGPKPKAPPVASLAEQYEEALRARDELHARNLETFDRERALADQIATLEDAIKLDTRPRYVGKPRGTYVDFRGEVATIKATAKYATSVDADAILAELPRLRDIPGVVVTTVDIGFVAVLAKAGKIDPDVVKRHTIEKQQTTAITFARTEDEEARRTGDAPIATVSRIR